jgi:SAM-dependent methyltransferase
VLAKKEVAMELAHSRHGNPDGRTPGRLVGHGRTYDIRAAILFGGRRRRVFGQLAAASRARPGDRVLDVGCGTGYLTRLMAQAVTPRGSAQGVDPSSEAITQAQRLTRNANCTFADGIAEALEAHSTAMATNRVDLLEPMVREAGFEQPRSGDLRPWIHYVRALKPTLPPGRHVTPTNPVAP